MPAAVSMCCIHKNVEPYPSTLFEARVTYIVRLAQGRLLIIFFPLPVTCRTDSNKKDAPYLDAKVL